MQNYGVSFPMMAKSDVNGSNTNEVFQFLKKEKTGILGTEMISTYSALPPFCPFTLFLHWQLQLMVVFI